MERTASLFVYLWPLVLSTAGQPRFDVTLHFRGMPTKRPLKVRKTSSPICKPIHSLVYFPQWLIVMYSTYYTKTMRFTIYGTPEVVLFLLLCVSFDFSLAVFTFTFHCPFFLLFSRLHIVLISMLCHAFSVCHTISADRITRVPICQALLSQFVKSKHVTGAARLTTVVTQRLQLEFPVVVAVISFFDG